jgi:putative oxidoreductase
MKSLLPFFFLKIALIAIFLMHSIPSIVTGDVNKFGKLYLDPIGFAPFGLYLAWLIKLGHVALCISLLTNKFLKPVGWINISILLVGIFILHIKDGWYVVGGGRNGVEFNVLLIAALLTIMYPKIVLFKPEAN